METGGYSIQWKQWLDYFNLSGDPFAFNEADQEQQLLSKIFVDRPYLHNVFGDPAHPQAAILKADRGGGKTATREMVAYECLHGKIRQRALPVRYFNFDHLLEQVKNDPTQITIHHHISSICRLILGEIQENISSYQIESLSEDERSLLKGFSAHFADPVTHILLSKILTGPEFELKWEGLTPYEILYNLGRLVSHLRVTNQERGSESDLRFCSIYVLVDRVDETSAGPDAALSILAPLVKQGPLINMPNLAFKFFLPVGTANELIRVAAVTSDRLCLEEINWGEEALRGIVDQRLLYFSNGYISHFEELCSMGLRNNAMHRLIDLCENSPRMLIRLCRSLIDAHLRLGTTGAFLDRSDLAFVIQNLKHTQEIEQSTENNTQVIEAAADNETSLEPQPENGLFIDRSGHIWIDGRQVTETFSEQEYRLLNILFSKSPKVVASEELIRSIWRDDFPLNLNGDSTADKQNLRKLVARLRDRLEPESSGKTSRFIKNAHGRGYWFEK